MKQERKLKMISKMRRSGEPLKLVKLLKKLRKSQRNKRVQRIKLLKDISKKSSSKKMTIKDLWKNLRMSALSHKLRKISSISIGISVIPAI